MNHTLFNRFLLMKKAQEEEDIPNYQKRIARKDGKEDEEYQRDIENITYFGPSN